MEPVRRSSMGSNNNAAAAAVAAAAAAASSASAVVGLLLSPSRPTTSAIVNGSKPVGPCGGGVNNQRLPPPLHHCGTNGRNVVVQQHQYHPSILVAAPSPLVRSTLVHPTQTTVGPLLPASAPQLMLSTGAAATAATEVIPQQYQQHGGGGSQQLISAAAAAAAAASVSVSSSPIVMPTSNITSVNMALSPFGILPHERVVTHLPYHRHQHKKLLTQPSKILMDTSINTSSAQILTAPVINSQRFYIEPTNTGNKIKPPYDSNQHQQQPHRTKVANGVTEKSLPVVSSAYVTQAYEQQRYQPRSVSQQVGYLSVITRTAVTTANSLTDDIIANNNYYQTQALPLQSKTPDNHERQYYHFENAASASQTSQQQLDNILQMGIPVQRGDPMHIVKNLQSMQTDTDCYGVKKMIEHQPRTLAIENSKTVGSTNLLSTSGKCIIENQHIQQLPKSAVIDPSSSYNGQYFNRRQPPPAHLHQHHNQPHLQQHLVSGNTKMLHSPTPLTVVSANGNTYLDVQQHQRHHRWPIDQQKSPTVSTSSCFSGNIPTGLFHQPLLHHQQYNSEVTTFNVQPPASSIHQHQQISHPVAHNSYASSSVNPTYYSPTTTIVTSAVTSVNTTTSQSLSYNRQQLNTLQNPNNFPNFSNNLQSGNFSINNDTLSTGPNVIVPNIEQELSHLCDDSPIIVSPKPLNIVSKQPSFMDSFIKFIQGVGDNNEKREDGEKPKNTLKHIASTTTRHRISKPYIPLSKPKIISASELTPSRNDSCEEIKKVSNIITTTDDDPRYFPLPKTSSVSDKSDSSFGENNLSVDDNQDQWWKSSLKVSGSSNNLIETSMVKVKINTVNKKKNNNSPQKRKQTVPITENKKQKTQHEDQPRRQLSHRMAKEKTQQLLSNINGGFDVEDDDLSDADSDIDPAWKPNSDDNDASKNLLSFSSRRFFSHKKYSKEQYSNSENTPSTSSSINNNNNDHLDDSTVPFKSGSFVALKSPDDGLTIPQHLWRVDGKSLLQKFEKCTENYMYKSVSTYTGWSSSQYNMYRQVPVKFITTHNGKAFYLNKFSSTDVVVQLLIDDDNKSAQNESVINTAIGHTDCNRVSKADEFKSISSSVDDQNILLRSNFDVYVQTLASQAIDSNFFGEIYRENDDFFISNISAIETRTRTWVQAISSAIVQDSIADLTKVENVHTVVTKYPNLEVCSTEDISLSNIQSRCLVCCRQGFMMKKQQFIEISLTGSEYDSRTLKDVDIDKVFPKSIPVKKVNCCSGTPCSEKLVILHSLEHLKYHIYQECCKRVATENELNQDTTTVLNRVLADDEWIEKLFQMACNTWSRAKSFVSKQSNCRVLT